MKQFFKVLIFVCIFTLILSGCAEEQVVEEEKQFKSWDKPPEMQIDPNKSYSAIIQTTKGEFTVELFADIAPITVNNFVFLANENFYDGIIFHRIIETFMIQTGDPLGTGRGGPGYQFEDELDTPHQYEPGILAMANSGENTNGSQFFICTGEDSRNLNMYPNYTIFGKVTEGMETVTNIAKTPVTMNPNGGDPTPSMPTEEVKIESIEIIES
ncbi:peptidylprolyl isomerase [Chengkuizengella axinellae]|uniref:Peptidyl-prolyl cis-trans isomerase n=1 Tax=Chengkuizengella axinellae TaxID=3064388 RepID=A0ABT9IXE0_9BACL|nr:peptidylprolyl isomerase [Chengkuizengella sp. 2205SS18-9]MDP5273978.1 peptidylprolyl isomerase [Chengkuizengella sp. 2205SS18-9]